MNCPLCTRKMTAKSDRQGWYAEYINPSCLLTVGKSLSEIKFYKENFGESYEDIYCGVFKSKKELKKYVNQKKIS
jgi:hypothetical protein